MRRTGQSSCQTSQNGRPRRRVNLTIQSQQSVNHCLGPRRRSIDYHWTHVASYRPSHARTVQREKIFRTDAIISHSDYTDRQPPADPNYRRSLGLLASGQVGLDI